MYRKEVVVRAMLPMALVAYTIYSELQHIEQFDYFLFSIGVAYVAGRWATRRRTQPWPRVAVRSARPTYVP